MMMRIPAGRKGFTMLELIIVCGIVIISLVGLLSTYITCLELMEATKNSQLALLEEQHFLEEMRNFDFPSIPSTYDGYNFQVPQMAPLESIGHVTVDNSSNPYVVTIGVCWRQKSGRIYGECRDVSGNLTFSDDNFNDVMDSPVQLVSLVTQR